MAARPSVSECDSVKAVTTLAVSVNVSPQRPPALLHRCADQQGEHEEDVVIADEDVMEAMHHEARHFCERPRAL